MNISNQDKSQKGFVSIDVIKGAIVNKTIKLSIQEITLIEQAYGNQNQMWMGSQQTSPIKHFDIFQNKTMFDGLNRYNKSKST